MKRNEFAPVVKGMIFAGCSFTWGQGLYYYSNLSTLKEPPPHHYHSDKVKWTHYEYMRSVRFPRLVANHFKQFEICQPFNGGASYSIHSWWEDAFHKFDPAWDPERMKSIQGDHYWQKYDYEDFSHIFYQFTQWNRGESPAMICKNDDGAIIQTTHITSMQHEDFPRWLVENNITPDEYVHQGRQKEIDDARNFLQNFEQRGIKAYVMSWPHDIVPYIKNDPWLSARLIEFDYKGNHYTNIEEMMGFQHQQWNEVPHPELTIFRDIRSFQEPPVDHHPSLTCHRVIADNIIKHLEKEQQSDSTKIISL